jgi:predicted porin
LAYTNSAAGARDWLLDSLVAAHRIGTASLVTCSGRLEAISFDADYRFTKRFDGYVGAMYSGVHDGVASGYFYTTNINPTVGVRYKF